MAMAGKPTAPARGRPLGRTPAAGGLGGFGGMRGSEALSDFQAQGQVATTQPMDPSASVASVASAAKVGELFQYTVGNVSLPRQRSAMIPIVTDDVEVERLSIYNPSVLPRNPLNGARVKNTTGKHLLQGPITVLQGASYAGDARIDNVPPGQERLISYGVDLQVLVDAKSEKQEDTVVAGNIVKGVLWVTRKHVAGRTYSAENKGEKDKTLIVEHLVRSGWKLVEPAKPLEKTDMVYRFKEALGAGKGVGLRVVEERVDAQQVALLGADTPALEYYGRTGAIPKGVKEVLAEVVKRKQALAETVRQREERRRQVADITKEQERLRENLKTVSRTGEYGARILKKLDDQETTIERLQGEIDTLSKKAEEQRKELEKFVQEANVEEKG